MRKLPDELLAQYPLISDQVSKDDVALVLRELQAVLDRNITGEVVEFGCYIGTTSLFIRRLLDANKASAQRAFHVYDSFEGLPNKSSEDASAAGTAFKAGELAASKKALVQAFRKAGLQLPIIHKNWFSALAPTDVPSQIAFAFLDGDFYESITTSLALVWPRMSAGGIILIDDYQREALPGVEKALHAFFRNKTKPHVTVSHNIARIVV